MRIEEKTYNSLPSHLKALFRKLPNHGSDEVLAGFPETSSGALQPYREQHQNASSFQFQRDKTFTQDANSGSAARFFYCAKASKEDREEGLDDLPLRDTQQTVNRNPESVGVQSPRAGAGRGAAAPIYRCAACGLNLQGGRAVTPCPIKGEHVKELVGYGERSRNHHPTVKPTDLMRYLVRLVTPYGGTVLDPFAGSGSTGKACAHEGMNAILIEKELEYCEIAKRRARLAQGRLCFEATA